MYPQDGSFCKRALAEICARRVNSVPPLLHPLHNPTRIMQYVYVTHLEAAPAGRVYIAMRW